MKKPITRNVLTLLIAAQIAFALTTEAAEQDTQKAAQKAKKAPAAPVPKVIPALNPAELQKIEAAVPKSASVKTAKERRLLIFWRCEGFFHGSGIAGGNKAMELMGKKTGTFSVDVSDDYAVFTPENLAKYDVLVFNNTTQLAFRSPEQKEAILDFVNKGKGVVGIHAATDNFYNWPDGAKMMGGLFDGHPWGGNGTWAFKIDEPDHILNKAFGGKGFKLKDEIYQFKDPYTRSDRRVLMTLDLDDPVTGGVKNGVKRTDKDFAIAWIKQQGQGRVFFCGLGHASNVFMEPAIQQFLLDGIQYAAGDLKADDQPKK